MDAEALSKELTRKLRYEIIDPDVGLSCAGLYNSALLDQCKYNGSYPDFLEFLRSYMRMDRRRKLRHFEVYQKRHILMVRTRWDSNFKWRPPVVSEDRKRQVRD